MSERKVWATSEDGTLEYVSISKDLLRLSIEAMQQSFYLHENVCMAFDMPNQPESFFEMDFLLLRAAQDGVSIAAVEKATGKVAGAAFNKLEMVLVPSNDCFGGHVRNGHSPTLLFMPIAYVNILPDIEIDVTPFIVNFIGKIEYTSLTSDRLGETIQLLRKSFFPYENVCKAIGLANIPEAIVECDDMVINTAKHGVSVVAIDKETGKMAGAVINKIQDKNTSSKKFYEEYIKNAQYPETRGIFEFLVHMEDSIDPFSPYDADCLMELVFLGVLPEYSKRGIGYMLCAVSIQLASLLYEGENVKLSLDNSKLPLEPRPQVVTALFTTFKSQNIGRKLNFDIQKTISCEDLYYDGRSYGSVLSGETKAFTIECKKLPLQK